MQRHTFNSDRGLLGNLASRFGAILAMTGLLVLSGCDSVGDSVTDNNLTDFGKDGVPPVLMTVAIQPDGGVEVGQSVRIDFVASEALMTPVVYINDVRADVEGNIAEWTAVREMTAADEVGEVTFSIVYEDISGELGQAVTATTNGSSADFCGEECPQEDGLGPLEGEWKLEFAGVGPAAGDTTWFSISDTGPDGPRACWFDDIYEFGADGSFQYAQQGDTWIEIWQGAVEDGCGAPVAPHDGSNTAVFQYDEDAASLTLSGQGAFLGLAKAVNGAELADPADAPEFVTYEVVELVGDSLTIRIDVGGGWWQFELSRISNSPIVGNWMLDFAGVGPAAGDTTWFSISDTGADGPRACWFDDVFHFAGDGSFQNFQQGDTWIEVWQGAVEDGCGAPVAPHDGSSVGTWLYDADNGTVTVNGLGSFLGLAKAVNGAELADPADAPESVTYEVVELVGDSMTIRIDVGGGWWEFAFKRVPAPDLRGSWKLEFAGVGPAAGDTTWFSISDTGADGPRACWFDDIYEFGRDGSFQYAQQGDTWIEIWQGAVEDGCGAPVAPHDGSNSAVFQYDEAAAALTLSGQGAFLGLAKAVNGAELALPADAPEYVTYEVVELVGDTMTIRIDVGGGWWQFELSRVSSVPVVGNWTLDFAGVGPAAGDTTWFSISDTGADGPRACWFDDVFHFDDNGSFQNFEQGDTWIEVWQGAVEDSCGAPVAPHDGSSVGTWLYDGDAGTVTVNGVGSFLGLAKAVNGAELTDPADAPDFVTYEVVELVGGSMKIRIDVGGGWWEFDLLKN